MKNKKEKGGNFSTITWILGRSKKHIPLVVLLALITGGSALIGVRLALISKDVLDIATGQADGSIASKGILLLSLVLIQILFSGLNTLLNAFANARLTISIRNRLFAKISNRKYSEISNYHSGDLLNRISSDVSVVVSAVVGIVPRITGMVTRIAGGITAILLLNRNIALIILVFGLTVPAIGRAINKQFKVLHKKCQETEGKTRSFMQECFENIVILKVFSGESSFSKKLNSYMHENYKMQMKRTGISVITHLSMFAFFTLGYNLIFLWGANNITSGVITYGTLTAFLQLFNQVRAPLQNVSGIMPQYYSMLASAERLIEIETGVTDAKNDNKKVEKLRDNFESIEFSGVDFAYKDEGTLKNCSFKANRGQITALTGESGSGKSTVLKLILGLYEPQNGKITINGTIPIDTSVRKLFTYVPQGNMILSGTIRENITLCNDKISEEAVIKAAKMACIYDIIEDLPEGFDTVLTERGGGLSEGQIQRISIARALLTDAPVLLLDEATSALDEATETELLENIKSMSDKTILFITHRNTSLKVCDKIIRVENKVFVTIKE